jgi:hypothetical protein
MEGRLASKEFARLQKDAVFDLIDSLSRLSAEVTEEYHESPQSVSFLAEIGTQHATTVPNRWYPATLCYVMLLLFLFNVKLRGVDVRVTLCQDYLSDFVRVIFLESSNQELVFSGTCVLFRTRYAGS